MWWMFGSSLIFGTAAGALVALLMPGDKLPKEATIIAICRDGTPIFKLPDGSFRARRSAVSSFPVEDPEHVCR